MRLEEHQDSLSERHIAGNQPIIEVGKIADVKMFGRFKNYFSGSRRYDIHTLWARRDLTTVRIDPAYIGN
jgi:hypothetical protein